MTFPDFEYLKSGLLDKPESVKNYFRKFKDNEIFSMDSRSYEKHRKPNMVGIFTSKGCVAKCTFCQRGSKGYAVYDLDKLEKYLPKNCIKIIVKEVLYAVALVSKMFYPKADIDYLDLDVESPDSKKYRDDYCMKFNARKDNAIM